ncbi:MAG: hypothetical protein IKL66_04590, partial [Clostridia bacterium]|nr:hypothetical protein [Clostridia bacterium]
MKRKNKFFDSAIIKEDGSKTTKNSKHFILNNGTRKAVFSSGSMNYFDESEKAWKTIDNSLKKTEDGYLADLGKYTAKISKEKDNETVEVSNGAETISWEYLGIDRNAFSDMENTTIRSNTKRRSKLNVKTKINDTLNISSASRAIYTDAEGNVDIDYLIEGNGVKENITVKEKSDSYRYYFLLRVAGFEMKTAADGVGIEFYKSNSDPNKTEKTAPEFIMPAPFTYDANGARSGNVTYTFEKIEDGMYIFSVEADAEWINSEDRVFPVCIDPQLLTVGDSHITVTHDQYQWCECSDCACNEYDWVHVGNPYYSHIYLHNNDSEKTSAKLNIKTDDIDLTRNTLISAKLIFEQCSGEKYSTSADIMIGNRSYTHNNGEKVTANITDIYNAKSEDFTVDLSMCSAEKTRKFCIPTLEIEYQPIYKAPVRKTLSVENGVSAEFDVLSGNATVMFDDIADSVLGVAVSHVYKPNDNIVEYGQNFRMNLDEKLVKTSTTATGAQYTYTDAHGDVHTFKEHFYRIGSNGEKVYITSEISSITADTDGRLWQGNVEVFRELTTDRGLRASARLEGAVNNAEWIDQRMDEEKQAEEQIKSYKNTLCNFVSVNKKAAVSSVITEDILSSPDSVESFLSEISCASHLLLSKEEALSYKSLLTQKESLNASKEALELQKESLKNSAESLMLQHDATDTFDYQRTSNNVQLKALQIERDYYNSTPNNSINTTNEEEATAPDKEEVTEEVETEEVETEEVETEEVETEEVETEEVETEEVETEEIETNNVEPEDVPDLQIGLIGSDDATLSSNTKIGLVNHHQNVIIPAQESDWNKQKSHIATQICNFPGIEAPASADNGTLTKQYYNTEEQIEIISEQLAGINDQIKLCREKSTQYAVQFKSYYKEYLNLSNQLETLKEQIPVSYLISDSAVKGFNAKGDLVIVQDKYGKYIVVEREKYT